jgi:hypothetical protein
LNPEDRPVFADVDNVDNDDDVNRFDGFDIVDI